MTNLLIRTKKGDAEAFAEIYTEYHPRIKKFISLLLHNDYDADEVTQELFTSLWSTRERLDPTGNFKGYLYRIAKNMTLNFLRDTHSYMTEDVLSGANVIQSTIATDEGLHAKELNKALKNIIEQLPAQRRKIYIMSRLEGMANSEIAAELNITKNAVERQISFATKDIRTAIESMPDLF